MLVHQHIDSSLRGQPVYMLCMVNDTITGMATTQAICKYLYNIMVYIKNNTVNSG